MTNLKVRVETLGCQMSKLDSETAAEMPLAAGFETAERDRTPIPHG